MRRCAYQAEHERQLVLEDAVSRGSERVAVPTNEKQKSNDVNKTKQAPLFRAPPGLVTPDNKEIQKSVSGTGEKLGRRRRNSRKQAHRERAAAAATTGDATADRISEPASDGATKHLDSPLAEEVQQRQEKADMHAKISL